MKTRVEIWEKYRSEIQSNNNLQRAVKNSNESLKLLYNRLLKLYPDYEKKYQFPKTSINANVNFSTSIPQFSNDIIEEILNKIKEKDLNDSFKKINNLDFSSHDCDEIIQAIKSHRTHRISYVVDPNSPDIFLSESCVIKLKSKKE